MKKFNTGIKGFDKIIEGIQKEHGDIVSDAFTECSGCWSDRPEYWVYLTGGYIFSGMDCGSAHEPNLERLRCQVSMGIEKQEK